MKIIAFLGNPGRKYKKNRHNAGFIVGEHFADKFNISIKKKKEFNSICGSGRINNTDILLIFPQTYMNNSGTAVNSAIQFYSEIPENLIVVHDEIELPFGEIKTKFGGGHKGHNGIRSIKQHLGTPDFHRMRLGVGRPVYPEMKVADYLLSNFNKEELLLINEKIPEILDLIVAVLK